MLKAILLLSCLNCTAYEFERQWPVAPQHNLVSLVQNGLACLKDLTP